jgi:hypothetical protein
MADSTSDDTRLVLEYPLPTALLVGTDALGSVTPLTIRSRAGHVHLPRLQGDDPVLRWPEAVDGLTIEQEYGWHEEGHESPWGYPTTWGLPVEPEDDELAVSRVVFTFPASDPVADRELLRQLTTSLDGWFDAVKDWCEVLHHQDLDYQAPRRRIELGGFGWLSWYRGAPEQVPGRISFDFERGQQMHRSDWEEVVGLVSAGAQPPASALLIRDALNARDRTQYRAALIDAATALEMALFGLIEEAQRSGTSSASPRKLEHLRERGSLTELVKHLSGHDLLPSTFDDALIRLRNDVVHKRARVPTKAEVDTMVNAATSTAEAAWPGWPRVQ